MEQKDNRVHFRKTLYFKMVVVTVFLGFTFFLALGFIYQLSTERFRKEMTAQSDALTEQICQNVETVLKELVEKTVFFPFDEHYSGRRKNVDAGA